MLRDGFAALRFHSFCQVFCRIRSRHTTTVASCMGVFSPLSILGLLIFAILISLILFLETNVDGYFNNYSYYPNQKGNHLCTRTLLNLEI